MDQKKAQGDLLRHISALIEGQKQDVQIYFSELKLKLPSYLKNFTIKELRDAGAIIDPNIALPKDTEDHLRSLAEQRRKKHDILDKLEEVREQYKIQVRAYYDDIKKQLPKVLLDKKMGNLTDEEWNLLGVDINKLR